VREDDQFRAQFTLRNTTKQAMKVEVTPRATLLDMANHKLSIFPRVMRAKWRGW
jgi:hypothetical protein